MCMNTYVGIVKAGWKSGGGGGDNKALASHSPVATVVRNLSQARSIKPPPKLPAWNEWDGPMNDPLASFSFPQQARAYGGLAWVLNPCRVAYEAFDVDDTEQHVRWSAVAYATAGRHLIAGGVGGGE